MHIRVVHATFDPGRLDEAVAVVREMGLPRMREAPGVHDVYVGTERASGRATIVSTWDTLEQASFAWAGPDFAARLQALGMRAEGPFIYEVTDQV